MKQNISLEYTEEEFKTIFGFMETLVGTGITLVEMAAENSENRRREYLGKEENRKRKERENRRREQVDNDIDNLREEIDEISNSLDEIKSLLRDRKK